MIELLLKKHANPNILDAEGDTPLTLEIKNESKLTVINLLLEKNSDPNVYGQIDPLQLILTKLNFEQKKKEKIITQLILSDFDVNQTKSDFNHLLHICEDKLISLETFDLILKKFKTIKIDLKKNNPLHVACSVCPPRREIIYSILQRDCSSIINEKNSLELTPLHILSKNKISLKSQQKIFSNPKKNKNFTDENILFLLLSKRADPNIVDNKKKNPSFYISSEFENIVTMIRFGCRIQKTDKFNDQFNSTQRYFLSKLEWSTEIHQFLPK